MLRICFAVALALNVYVLHSDYRPNNDDQRHVEISLDGRGGGTTLLYEV